MNDPQLPERLAQRLRLPLPGWRVQRAWQPELSYGRHFGPPGYAARPAVVLALLYPDAGEWRLPLTLRPGTLVEHAGQVCLPGGAIDPGERSQDAALRELEEELGVAPAGIELLGELSPLYLYSSNYWVRSHVAVAHRRPDWRPHTLEVAELYEIPLQSLAAPGARAVLRRGRNGVESLCPGFTWGERHIWGFTSLVLAELLALVAEPPIDDR